MDFYSVLDLGAAFAALLSSLCLLIIAQKYYNQTRLNVRRLLYMTTAGGAFVFGLYLLGRSSPLVFDPVLRYIPINPVERVMALSTLLLALHNWSHIREAAQVKADHHVPIIPRALLFWKKFDGHEAQEKGKQA